MNSLSSRPGNTQWLRKDYTDAIYQSAAGNIQLDSLDVALQDAGFMNIYGTTPTPTGLTTPIQSITASNVQDTVTNNLVGANLSRTYQNNDSVALTIGQAVYLNASNQIARADKDVAAQAKQTIGLVKDPSIAVGVYGKIVEAGLLMNVLTSAVPNQLFYLGNLGTITSTIPTSGQIIVVGWAKNATDLYVKITTLAGLAQALNFFNAQFGSSNYLDFAYPGASPATDPIPLYGVAFYIGLEDDLGFQGQTSDSY